MSSCLLPEGISVLSRTEKKTGALSGQLQNMERGLCKNVRHEKIASEITNVLFKLTKTGKRT